MANLSISNVINIQVSATPSGLGEFNTGNLAIFTHETPGADFGSDPYKVYLTASEVAKDFGSNAITTKMANAVFAQSPNILSPGGSLKIFPLLTEQGDNQDELETIAAALARTSSITPYVGVLTTNILSQTELLAAAAVLQADYKVGFFPGIAAADIEVGGKLDLLRSGGFNRTRGLYYGLSSEGALIFAAAYASRGMSVNYSGSNTTLTMNLKDLATVPVDTTMTQTLKGKAEAAGADIYASIEGLSKVLSFGANKYFDQVFNLIWFCKKLEVDCFNYLAMSSTKVPQTEMGADGFDNVCRKVCAQAVLNAYAAPGEWTISDTFGDPATFKQNITEQGYYVWHSPVANQSAAERAGRKLPLCQVALKEAGAVHGASVLVYINA